jgi:hypothetical protein
VDFSVGQSARNKISGEKIRESPHMNVALNHNSLSALVLPICIFIFEKGKINQATFDNFYGAEMLNLEGTQLEFAGWAIAKYKECGRHLEELKDVPTGFKGSIDVIGFMGADLRVLNLSGCKDITGKKFLARPL